jgi:hypothetical protein
MTTSDGSFINKLEENVRNRLTGNIPAGVTVKTL